MNGQNARGDCMPLCAHSLKIQTNRNAMHFRVCRPDNPVYRDLNNFLLLRLLHLLFYDVPALYFIDSRLPG